MVLGWNFLPFASRSKNNNDVTVTWLCGRNVNDWKVNFISHQLWACGQLLVVSCLSEVRLFAYSSFDVSMITGIYPHFRASSKSNLQQTPHRNLHPRQRQCWNWWRSNPRCLSDLQFLSRWTTYRSKVIHPPFWNLPRIRLWPFVQHLNHGLLTLLKDGI